EAGEGFVTPGPWRARNLRFGTDELIGLIERAAAEVSRQFTGGKLAVADISAAQGGPVAHHASHQSGRDADLIYYAIDRDGNPFPPDDHMAYYGLDARSVSAESPEPAGRIDERYFDLQRNWALVAALVSDPDVQVSRIFVSSRVRGWLLAYARARAAPPELLARAQAVLFTAGGDSGSHQDHMHIRIGCSGEDVAAGRCSDESAPRPRSRHRRGKRHRHPPPQRWYAHVRCAVPGEMVADSGSAGDSGDEGEGRAGSASKSASSAKSASKQASKGGKHGHGSTHKARSRTAQRPGRAPSRRDHARTKR
ncbi:MAG TPA: penicillin-insensitive murein endopeptidase, partial [Kofleriaceae bacterium]|nr:penicillin-insensitive murein endopeptidase [Kofleriaceae bacterium]